MNKNTQIGTSLLWAAAIVASAALGAPASVTLLLLPVLAMGSLLVGLRCADRT